jgi:hypothetical protein
MPQFEESLAGPWVHPWVAIKTANNRSENNGNGGQEAASPGEHEVNRKTIARGKPGSFSCTRGD